MYEHLILNFVYRDLLTRLIVLMNEALSHEVDDTHWDEVLETRYQMQMKKQMLSVIIFIQFKIYFTIK